MYIQHLHIGNDLLLRMFYFCYNVYFLFFYIKGRIYFHVFFVSVTYGKLFISVYFQLCYIMWKDSCPRVFNLVSDGVTGYSVSKSTCQPGTCSGCNLEVPVSLSTSPVLEHTTQKYIYNLKWLLFPQISLQYQEYATQQHQCN